MRSDSGRRGRATCASYWGRGIASAALAEFLGHDAFVAVHNVGSICVLEKCGFVG